MRVVFDTNVLASALVFPSGRGAAALRRVIEGVDELLLSKPILDELLDVLACKFAREAEELSHAAVFMSELSTMVSPKRRRRVVVDEPDIRILECANAGGAQAVVTGDKALLALKISSGIRIMSLAAYLEGH